MNTLGEPDVRSLDVRGIVEALDRFEVRYVLIGSLAAAAWAGRCERRLGDLDLAPDLAVDNLARLATLLEDVGARPVYRPDWKRSLSLEQIAVWTPRPATVEQLDHQMVTRWGLVDVVPALGGSYADVWPRSQATTAWGTRVRVAHPADLIATLRPDREEKHRRRVEMMNEALRRVDQGKGPVPLETLELGDRT